MTDVTKPSVWYAPEFDELFVYHPPTFYHSAYMERRDGQKMSIVDYLYVYTCEELVYIGEL